MNVDLEKKYYINRIRVASKMNQMCTQANFLSSKRTAHRVRCVATVIWGQIFFPPV